MIPTVALIMSVLELWLEPVLCCIRYPITILSYPYLSYANVVLSSIRGTRWDETFGSPDAISGNSELALPLTAKN